MDFFSLPCPRIITEDIKKFRKTPIALFLCIFLFAMGCFAIALPMIISLMSAKPQIPAAFFLTTLPLALPCFLVSLISYMRMRTYRKIFCLGEIQEGIISAIKPLSVRINGRSFFAITIKTPAEDRELVDYTDDLILEKLLNLRDNQTPLKIATLLSVKRCVLLEKLLNESRLD